ncbi:MAG TPA: hypothetical protein VGA69_04325 [Nitriliruptorales bacterium]
MTDEPGEQRRRRSTTSSSPSDDRRMRWEVRRNRKPWQRFLEKFGFTLMAIGIAMMVGVLIAKMG